MFILLYTLLLYLLIPFILLRLFLKSLRTPAYWQRWQERFGFFPAFNVKNSIWIHTVSVGEFQAAIPLIKSLRKQFPHRAILITTMTPTGSERVKAVFGDQVQHVYLPYDLPDAIHRFLRRTQPQLLILMETEIWINLVHICHKKKMPILLVNARLSEKSATGYRKIKVLMKPTLQKFTAIAAQTQEDAKRFIDLGASAKKIYVVGNIKFDLHVPKTLLKEARLLRHQWHQRPIWIVASTHEGEEEKILAAFEIAKQRISRLLLILVPRHPERFERIAQLCIKQGYQVARRSYNEIGDAKTDIYLGDTMGELLLLYAASDIAFVGGSLVEVGGHNLLEPAAVGIPVITGQHTFNFADITRQLLNLKIAYQVTNVEDLSKTVINYCQNEHLRQQHGRLGQQFVQANQGALAKLLTIIGEYVI